MSKLLYARTVIDYFAFHVLNILCIYGCDFSTVENFVWTDDEPGLSLMDLNLRIVPFPRGTLSRSAELSMIHMNLAP